MLNFLSFMNRRWALDLYRRGWLIKVSQTDARNMEAFFSNCEPHTDVEFRDFKSEAGKQNYDENKKKKQNKMVVHQYIQC